MKKNQHKQNKRKPISHNSAAKIQTNNNKKLSMPEAINFENASHQDQSLITLLHEYLLKHQFLQTLQHLQKQCSKGIKSSNKTINALKQQIIAAFDSGNRQNFFVRFSQYIPHIIRLKHQQTIKLEFFLQVYFFIYSIHPQLGKKKVIDNNSKQAYIQYLQTRGAPLGKNKQFIPYFAISNIPKLQQNAQYKQLFTKNWAYTLRERLIDYLTKLFPIDKKPQLISMYDRYIEKNLQNSNVQYYEEEIEEQIQSDQNIEEVHNHQQVEMLNNKINQLEENKSQLINFIENANKKYQSLQNNYKDFVQTAQTTLMESQVKWFNITQQFFNISNQLLKVCKKYQRGQPYAETDKIIIASNQNKLSKYESFVNTNIQDLLSDNVDFSLFERTDHDISTDMVRKTAQYRNNHLIQLNFTKIHNCLKDAKQHEDISLLLEALRWRITTTRGILTKREVVVSYAIFDLLGLKKGDNTFRSLVKNDDHQVIFNTGKFLSSLARDFYGRQYMVCQLLLRQCIETILDESIDMNTRTYFIVALQQISVRKTAQLIMIESNLIKWLVSKMNKQRQTLSSYLMQYLSTLLLNLLLRKQGLEKSQQIKQEILQTLINLMWYEVIDVRSYIHGALYPLLSRKSFREKAKEYGMEETIKYLMDNSPPQFMNQLRYLQTRLNMQQDENQQDDEQGDNQFDEINDDEIGEDFQQYQQVKGTLNGQQLLMKKYHLSGPQAITQLNMIRQEAQNSLKKKSVFDANSVYERSSANTPIIGKLKRNISNNNSVYSNRSSNNRALKSQIKSREQQKPQQQQQRLDTVHQNNSEISIKQLAENQQRQKQRQKEEHKEIENQQAQKINEKAHQKSKGYRETFQTRAKLVRTPPQKKQK